MAAFFQTALMRLALCGLATSLLVLVLRSRMARDTFARLLSIWRSLTAFGRVAVCSFLLIGVLVGGDKTNSVNNLPPQQMMSPMVQQGHGFLLTGLAVNGNLANVMNLVQPQTTFAERKIANWNIRGAWKDSLWLDFEDDFVFPWGTNHLSGVEVVSYGQVWATPFDTNAIASAGAPVETNAVADISWEGSDGALFWSDAAATQPLSSLSGISLSSVTGESGGDSYTFYMTSPNIGSGSFTASFTLPSGETRGAAKSYRAIEPIRKLITNDRDETSRGIINPSRLTYDPNHEVFENPDAVLSVSVNGQFGASEVRWSVVSGPGEIVSTNGWRSTVRATAATGTVVVEARFNDDDLQPRFVLPIVTPRVIPIKVFVVSAPDDNEDAEWGDDEITDQVGFANLIYRQIGIKFNLVSTTRNAGTADDWHIQPFYKIPILGIEMLTSDYSSLLDTYSSNDCVEVYCLGDFIETRVWGLWTRKGIALRKHSPLTVLAHELGHALGLKDCYVDRKIGQNVSIVMSNADSPIGSDMFGSIAVDWCAGSGRGFTESSDRRRKTIMNLLMHGCADEYSSNGRDIPSSTMKALHKNSSTGTDIDYVDVGAEQINPINTEVYSQ